MREPDAFDMQDAEEEGPERANLGACRRCGKRVEFIATGVRWRKYEEGALKLHVCNDVDPREFQPIKE